MILAFARTISPTGSGPKRAPAGSAIWTYCPPPLRGILDRARYRAWTPNARRRRSRGPALAPALGVRAALAAALLMAFYWHSSKFIAFSSRIPYVLYP